ncbi:MAG TPA: YdcF family protein [Minicystis sp.]|nr:YdcF family protein [Minicystis sp.]
MDATFSRWIDPALLPLLLLGAALVVLSRDGRSRAARRARVAAWAGWAALWIAATPILSDGIIRAVEVRPDAGAPDAPLAALEGVPRERTAIVVLGAGLKTDEPTAPPRERLNEAGMGRVLGAARLWHAHPTGLFVVAGGPDDEADAMLDLAVHEGVPRGAIEVDRTSRNTRENAVNSAAILRARRVDRVVVVTSALHMRRALADFAKAGVTAVAAPVDFEGRRVHGVRSLFPDAFALGRTYRALHELLGLLKP